LPAEVNPTVVTLDDEPGLNEGAPFPDMGIHEPVREASTPGSGLKKRGRPSRSASATPARTPAKTPKSSKTPRTAKSAAAATPKSNTGRKRKAAEVEENEEQAGEDNSEPAPAEPPVKRGRPGRKAAAAAPASARLAAKVANKPTRGRPKATSTEDVSILSVKPRSVAYTNRLLEGYCCRSQEAREGQGWPSGEG